jgi:hypothetical protein
VIVYVHTLGCVLKISEVAQILGLLFHGTSYVFSLTNNWLGNILGDLFKNSSDHPGPEEHFNLRTVAMNQMKIAFDHKGFFFAADLDPQFLPTSSVTRLGEISLFGKKISSPFSSKKA